MKLALIDVGAIRLHFLGGRSEEELRTHHTQYM